MSISILLVLLIAFASVDANITGQHPVSGTCFCITGTNVNAHVSASLHSTVHASLNTGDCYKFHGGILTKDGYTWYQLQNVNGENLWVAGTLLKIGTSSQCSHSSSGSCSDSQSKAYACELIQLHNAGKIKLWQQHPSRVHDNAYAYNNIRDACAGHAVSRSHYTCSTCTSPGAPGGHVCLSRNLLHYLVTLARKGYIHVNEVAGACHSCNSRHYKGMAVDLDIGSRNSEFLTTCTSMGGWGQNEGNHIHCQFYS